MLVRLDFNTIISASNIASLDASLDVCEVYVKWSCVGLSVDFKDCFFCPASRCLAFLSVHTFNCCHLLSGHCLLAI